MVRTVDRRRNPGAGAGSGASGVDETGGEGEDKSRSTKVKSEGEGEKAIAAAPPAAPTAAPTAAAVPSNPYARARSSLNPYSRPSLTPYSGGGGRTSASPSVSLPSDKNPYVSGKAATGGTTDRSLVLVIVLLPKKG